MRLLMPFVVVFVCAGALWAQVPTDVPKGHWAYGAVMSLVEKGYLEGYTDGTFLGKRALTRYEFATVIKRIVDRIAQVGPAAAGDHEFPAKPDGADIEAARRLIDEFKTELAVIGTRLDDVESALAGMQVEIDSLKEAVADQQKQVEAARADISKLKRVAVSGYIQARYTMHEGHPDDPSKNPSDSFSVRRARLKVSGKPTEKSTVVLQGDFGQNFLAGSGPSFTLKDAYAEYTFGGAVMQIGQFKWPFGYEVPQSSSARETPERALVVTRFFPGERDRGIAASWPLGSKWTARLGVFNGNEAKLSDPNDAKDAVAALRYCSGRFAGGVSAYRGRGIVDDAGGLYLGNSDPKTRLGTDAHYSVGRLALKAEYIRGKGIDGLGSASNVPAAIRNTISGGWAQAAYSCSAADTFVVKWETISEDPKYPQYGRRSAWDFGLLRRLDEKTLVKAFYQANSEERSSFDNNNAVFEWQGAY